MADFYLRFNPGNYALSSSKTVSYAREIKTKVKTTPLRV